MRLLAPGPRGRAAGAGPASRNASGSANATRPERPGDDRVDDVADHALQAPPLAGGHDDGERDEGEADAVAAVLRLEVAGRAADAAHGAAGHVRHPHPGAAHRAQRQRQAAAPRLRRGLAARCRLARPGGAAPPARGTRGRGTAGGAGPCGGGSRAGRHARRLRESAAGITRHTHAATARSARGDDPFRPGQRPGARLTWRKVRPAGWANRVQGRYLRSQVMSASVQPRLAGRQPSSAVGCSG